LAQDLLEVTHVVLQDTAHGVQPGDQLKDLVNIGSKALCFMWSVGFKKINVDGFEADILVGKRRTGDATSFLRNADDTAT
jgi:hypothetical protein